MIPKIATNYDYPPIPIRSMDWSAWYEGEEDEQMDVGTGPTEAAAILDLIENYSPVSGGYAAHWRDE